MQGKLKQRYQIHKEVSRNGYFQGQIDVEKLSRLCELLASNQGEITLKFEFKHSDFDVPMISGKIQTSLQVVCQRCLQAMETALGFDFRLLVDAADDTVSESGLDSVYSEDGNIDIFEVVEDEIILALPLVSMHQNDTCNEHWQAADNSLEPVIRENPFSVLKDLKTKH
jgi:uncharacterized protein